MSENPCNNDSNNKSNEKSNNKDGANKQNDMIPLVLLLVYGPLSFSCLSSVFSL